jgi:ribosomal protein L11 methyltransferase
MNEISFHGKRVLDVGTGSGILAIIADKLGAKSLTAIDNDSDAIANAGHNFQLNQTNKIDLRCCSIHAFEESEFDIVLANIDFKSLSFLGSRFHDLMRDRGNLIISGILADEASQIESLYANAGLTLLKQQNLNEWTAMHFSPS